MFPCVAVTVGSPEEQAEITFMMGANSPPLNAFDFVSGLVGFDAELIKLLCAALRAAASSDGTANRYSRVAHTTANW